jgi:S1-C subfamily serine protease
VSLLAAVIASLGLAGCGSVSERGSAAPKPTVRTTVTARTSTAPPSTDPLPALVTKTRSAVVRIEAKSCDGQAIGTGFLISPTLVATVEHVVDGANSINLKQGGRSVATGTVIGQDPARDVALVRSSAPIRGAVLRLAPRAPQLGESVAALGFPLGLPLTVTKGSVSGLGRSVPIDEINRRQMVQTDAAVNPGNSGGPLLSIDTGDVVGLVDLGTTQANGIAFAVSAQVAQPLLSAWRTAPQETSAGTCPNPTPAGIITPPDSTTNSGGGGQQTDTLGPEPAPTGQDPAGYNVGPGCSDDPSSPLPGCGDSPSTPNGDPAGSCPNGITVDSKTTSCSVAENVRSNYSSDGLLTAVNPATGQSLAWRCLTGRAGTTGYTICEAQTGSGILYLRWHQ